MCHAAQLGDVYVGVEVGMRDEQVCGKAQRAAHAAQSCNVVQGLITLPDILLKMLYDAAEHVGWQVGDRHGRLVRHCATVVMVLGCCSCQGCAAKKQTHVCESSLEMIE